MEYLAYGVESSSRTTCGTLPYALTPQSRVLDLIDIDAHGFQFFDGQLKSVGEEAVVLHACVDTKDWDATCNAIRYHLIEHLKILATGLYSKHEDTSTTTRVIVRPIMILDALLTEQNSLKDALCYSSHYGKKLRMDGFFTVGIHNFNVVTLYTALTLYI